MAMPHGVDSARGSAHPSAFSGAEQGEAVATAAWMADVRVRVDERLESFFARKREESAGISPGASELVDAIATLTMRGGKRLRPAVIVAAYRAVAPATSEVSCTVDASAAVELLQSYLLIHDDWMDQDDERRGGPSVHAALSKAHKNDRHL